MHYRADLEILKCAEKEKEKIKAEKESIQWNLSNVKCLVGFSENALETSHRNTELFREGKEKENVRRKLT